MGFISGPVSVTVNGQDISDHVISITVDDVEMEGWAAPACFAIDDYDGDDFDE